MSASQADGFFLFFGEGFSLIDRFYVKAENVTGFACETYTD